MVRTTWRWAISASTRFFSHEGQNERPRQEKATSTLLRHSGHKSRAKPCSSSSYCSPTRTCCSWSRRTGELALVKAAPDAFVELARVPAIHGKTWSHSALVGDVVLVRNGDEMTAFRPARAGG
jgi:hypothetical protein